MGLFYGNINNSTNFMANQFQFDKIFSNRFIMDNTSSVDEIFIGRYVFIDYDQDLTDTLQRGYLVDGKYSMSSEKFEPFENLPEGSYIWVMIDENGDIINSDKPESFKSYDSKCLFCQWKNGASLNETGTFNTDNELNNAKNIITPLPESIENKTYAFNSKIDIYHRYTTDVDSTVWQKTYLDNTEKYVMISKLNAENPTIKLKVNTPAIGTPTIPTLDIEDELNYTLSLAPQVGIRIAEAKDENNSDEETTHYLFTENKDVTPVKKNAAIYFNKDGLDQDTRHEDIETENTIIMEQSGYSGYPYSVEEPSIVKDVFEITVNMPAIGNMVSEGWDLLYGYDEETNKRNLKTVWNETGQLKGFPYTTHLRLTNNERKSYQADLINNSVSDTLKYILENNSENNISNNDILVIRDKSNTIDPWTLYAFVSEGTDEAIQVSYGENNIVYLLSIDKIKIDDDSTLDSELSYYIDYQGEYDEQQRLKLRVSDDPNNSQTIDFNNNTTSLLGNLNLYRLESERVKKLGESSISGLEARLGELEEYSGYKDTSYQNQVTGNLQAQIVSNDTDISDLNDFTGINDSDRGIGTLQSQILSNDTDIQTNVNSINSLNSFTGINDSNRGNGTLQSQILSNDTDISNLDKFTGMTGSTKETSLQVQIESNDTDISELNTFTGINDSNKIAGIPLQTQIISNDTDISNLQARFGFDPTSSGMNMDMKTYLIDISTRLENIENFLKAGHFLFSFGRPSEQKTFNPSKNATYPTK